MIGPRFIVDAIDAIDNVLDEAAALVELSIEYGDDAGDVDELDELDELDEGE